MKDAKEAAVHEFPETQKENRTAKLKKDFHRNWQLYVLLIPGLLILVFFKIGPVGAMIIAFQKFSAYKGVFGSQWVGLANFKKLFTDPYILTLVKNTVILALMTILISFPIPIIFALFLNEVRQKKLHSMIQSFSFLPYFISSAVMVSILCMILSPQYGLINAVRKLLGLATIDYMASPSWFRPLYIILEIWQTCGYNAIIYIAAMISIDPNIYEAAEVDGANRWDKMFRITLPSMMNTIMVMLIISVGNIFSVNLDRILLMYNQSTYATADVLQTYVYRIAFESSGYPNYSYGTAVNMVKSVIAFILVRIVNKIADKVSDE